MALAAATCAAATGGCASRAVSDEPQQYLDEQSAATITVAAEPIVFARERPELAVNAREYLTLVPVDVNRSGVHRVYFFGYAWSTLDDRGAAGATDATPVRFELAADGRRILLEPAAAAPRELGLAAAPIEKPSRAAIAIVATVDREALEFLASATEIRATRDAQGRSEAYELWRDGRPALEPFLAAVPAPHR